MRIVEETLRKRLKLTPGCAQWMISIPKRGTVTSNLSFVKTFPLAVQPLANVPSVSLFAMHLERIQEQDTKQREEIKNTEQ